MVIVFGWFARLIRLAELDDQVEACRRIFASNTKWTVVRGSDLQEAKARASPPGAGTSATRYSKAT